MSPYLFFTPYKCSPGDFCMVFCIGTFRELFREFVQGLGGGLV